MTTDVTRFIACDCAAGRVPPHHYVTTISVAGAAITVASIAGQIGIAMIPVVGLAAAGTKAAAKEAGKKATKEAAHSSVESPDSSSGVK